MQLMMMMTGVTSVVMTGRSFPVVMSAVRFVVVALAQTAGRLSLPADDRRETGRATTFAHVVAGMEKKRINFQMSNWLLFYSDRDVDPFNLSRMLLSIVLERK